ncbi:2-hydroxyacid dehydrogenase [Nitrospira sp. Kam-Ns4a]
MCRPTLYLTRRLPDPVMDRIREQFHLTAPVQDDPPDPSRLREGLREAEALLSTLTERVDAVVLGEARRLRVIANYAVGYNNIDLDAARARGVVVTNTPDVLTDATADLTWALLLAVSRRLIEGDALVRRHGWTGWTPTQLLGADVSGQTLGIVGMGRIGRAVARRAAGFGMAVRYYTRTDPDPATLQPEWRRVSFERVLAESDFLTLHVPLTPETRHLLDAAALRQMRPTAFLINTSRGPVVDEAALVEALRQGWIAGAGLDVYEEEPAVHPALRALPQVVLLPHLGSATLATRVKMGLVCLENIRAVLEGRPAPNRVA